MDAVGSAVDARRRARDRAAPRSSFRHSQSVGSFGRCHTVADALRVSVYATVFRTFGASPVDDDSPGSIRDRARAVQVAVSGLMIDFEAPRAP